MRKIFLCQTVVDFTEDGYHKVSSLYNCKDCIYFVPKRGDRRFNICRHELGMITPSETDFCSLLKPLEDGHNTLTSMKIEKEDKLL